jgi:hypothetical protein
MKILWSRLKHFFDNLDGKMDADRYFEVCDQLNKEPIEEESEPEPKKFDNVTNPAMKELDNKEQKLASEQLVDTTLDAYEMLHQLFQKIEIFYCIRSANNSV